MRISTDFNRLGATKPDRSRSGPTVHRHRGFTLVELLIASSVAILIGGATMLMLIESAKENYRGIADATVEQAVGDLQQRLIQQLRSMSASAGVQFSSPVTNGAKVFSKSIIVAQGPPNEGYPSQQISFNSSTKQVLHIPNRANTNATVSLTRGGTNAVVRQLLFSPSLKPDGTVDNALVNVRIEMDDNGFSRRVGVYNPASVCRTFSVRMRNN